MTYRGLIWASLRRRWRIHLGVLLGAVLGSAVLIGALIVGDSVRGSLREFGLQRLVGHHLAMSTGDRFYRADMFSSLEPRHTLAGHVPATPTINPARYELTAYPVSMLHLPATVTRQDRSARANQIQVYGMPPGMLFRRNPSASSGAPAFRNLFDEMEWESRVNQPLGSVILNEALASQLKARPGEEVVLRIHKPSTLSRDAVITPRDDQSVALRLVVHSIVTGEEGGNLSLTSSQLPPLNAFVRSDDLDQVAGVPNRVNLTLIPAFALRDGSTGWQRWHQWFSRVSHKIFGADLASTPTSLPLAEDSDQLALMNQAVDHLWDLADAQLELRQVPGTPTAWELISQRIFLEDAIVAAAQTGIRTNRQRPEFSELPAGVLPPGQGVLTYLVNSLRAGTNMAPYSMVTAAPSPWTPSDLQKDEIVVNEWLAEDLHVGPGDVLQMSYYLLDTGSHLSERTNQFRVRSVVPLQGVHNDRTLMPEYPGLAKAESTKEWDAGFPLVHPIRDKDEAYWKKYRGTPKAFVSLAAGQEMWSNRFGRLTSIRFSVSPGVDAGTVHTAVRASVLSNLDPANVGLLFQPVRQQALQAAQDAQDFGGLFIGFSFFLILAALILMALLFQFGVEQRQTELGTLLAIGFRPGRIRNLLLWEGVGIALLGGALGTLGGAYYARALLWALGTLWRGAVGTSSLFFHATASTLLTGVGIAVGISILTIALVLRKSVKRPAHELLSEQIETARNQNGKRRHSISRYTAILAACGALALLLRAILSSESLNPAVFFAAGGLSLVAGLATLAAGLNVLSMPRQPGSLSRVRLALDGLSRRRTRSLAAAALLACGSFLIVAIGANRLDATQHADRRHSGTGGFSLIGETALPVVEDLNQKKGRESFGLDETPLHQVSFVPFRLRPGDDASCLNLNRAQRPRILGVDPRFLAERGAFQFAGAAKGFSVEQGWSLLNAFTNMNSDVIPAIGDAASIEWALNRSLGDTLRLIDERGHEFQLKLVASLANSILQGNLIIHEAEFTKRFPSMSGHQFFLIDAPANERVTVSAELSRGLQDVGLEVMPAVVRLAQFNRVQNTYLNTFQILGGLGLLLGSLGLGVVLLRNTLERRNELALLRAVGLRGRTVELLVLGEHCLLLICGLGIGVAAAILAVSPVVFSATNDLPVGMLGILLSGVFVLGLASTWLATRVALRGTLLNSLRPE